MELGGFDPRVPLLASRQLVTIESLRNILTTTGNQKSFKSIKNNLGEIKFWKEAEINTVNLP